MTKTQVAVIQQVIDRAASRSRTSRIDGESLWLHSFIIQPLTDVLSRDLRLVDDSPTAHADVRAQQNREVGNDVPDVILKPPVMAAFVFSTTGRFHHVEEKHEVPRCEPRCKGVGDRFIDASGQPQGRARGVRREGHQSPHG